jgi:hypothetical protein
MWSFNDCKLISDIPYITTSDRQPLIYNASFSRSLGDNNHLPKYIITGCDLANEAKIYRTDVSRFVGAVSGFSSAVYSVALRSDDKMAAIGSGSKHLLICDIDASLEDEVNMM